MPDDEGRAMVAAEQTEFAALLTTLTPDQWGAPSLCEGWSVHETVIHVTIHTHSTQGQLFSRLLRARFDDLRMHTPERALPTEELIARLEAPAVLSSGKHTRTQLSELVAHQQDIRRPLGATRIIPPERLRIVLDYGATWSGGMAVARAHRRGEGLRLEATDISWSSGEGPEVTGPGEALFMALNGRPDALSDLEGPGLVTLSNRVD